MIGRPDREDVSRQQAALQTARDEAERFLTDLAKEAARAAKAVRRGDPDWLELAAVWHAVKQCEVDLDTAKRDLTEASGDYL